MKHPALAYRLEQGPTILGNFAWLLWRINVHVHLREGDLNLGPVKFNFDSPNSCSLLSYMEF